MDKRDYDSDWLLPSFGTVPIKDPVTGKTIEKISGANELTLNSYLEKFGCVPISPGRIPRRRIARLINNVWVISEPDGTADFERPVQLIDDPEKQLHFLTSNRWHYIGYFEPVIIEFEFGIDGNGFSRRLVAGYDKVVPTINDYYWCYSLSRNVLNIEWEEGSNSKINFCLKKQWRASFTPDGKATFYGSTLEVDSHLFPPTVAFTKFLAKEYWGKEIVSKENLG